MTATVWSKGYARREPWDTSEATGVILHFSLVGEAEELRRSGTQSGVDDGGERPNG